MCVSYPLGYETTNPFSQQPSLLLSVGAQKIIEFLDLLFVPQVIPETSQPVSHDCRRSVARKCLLRLLFLQQINRTRTIENDMSSWSCWDHGGWNQSDAMNESVYSESSYSIYLLLTIAYSFIIGLVDACRADSLFGTVP